MYSKWQDYADTLERMNRVSEQWSSARTFEELDTLIRLNCAELVDPNFVYEFGFDKLCADLAAQEYSGDMEKAALRIMFAATARPAIEYDHILTGEDYGYASGALDGSFVNELDGALVSSTDQFADPEFWTVVPAAPADGAWDEDTGDDEAAEDDEAQFVYYPPTKLWYRGEDWFLRADETTRVVEDDEITDVYRDDGGNLYREGQPFDLRVEHYLRKLRRWRKMREDGEFEFWHDGAQGYFFYDPASDYWFDGAEWVKYDELADSLARRARRPEAEAELNSQIAETWRSGLDASIARIRERVPESVLSDAQIAAMLQQSARGGLTAAAPKQ